MTQEEQQEFKQSLESAKSWIQVVRERLQQNDNTQGPREDLQARVRATEVELFWVTWDLWYMHHIWWRVIHLLKQNWK